MKALAAVCQIDNEDMGHSKHKCLIDEKMMLLKREAIVQHNL